MQTLNKAVISIVLLVWSSFCQLESHTDVTLQQDVGHQPMEVTRQKFEWKNLLRHSRLSPLWTKLSTPFSFIQCGCVFDHICCSAHIPFITQLVLSNKWSIPCFENSKECSATIQLLVNWRWQWQTRGLGIYKVCFYIEDFMLSIFKNILSIPGFTLHNVTPQLTLCAISSYLFIFTVPVKKPPYPVQLIQIISSLSIHSKLANLCLVTFLTLLAIVLRRRLLSLFFLSSDCCHFPFVLRAQYPEGFLTNWFLTMRFSVSKTYLTCTFISFHHSIPLKMHYISFDMHSHTILGTMSHCLLLQIANQPIACQQRNALRCVDVVKTTCSSSK